MRINSYTSLVIILEVQVQDFLLNWVDPERDSPVSCDMKTPGSFAVSCKLMHLPARHVAHLLDLLHVLEEGENVANLLHHRRVQTGDIVALNEAAQPAMDYVPYLHT